MANASYEQIGNLDSAKPLNVPAGAHAATITVSEGDVRYRLDGTDPTSDVGQVLPDSGWPPLEITNARLLASVKFIRRSNIETPRLDVHYFISDADA